MGDVTVAKPTRLRPNTSPVADAACPPSVGCGLLAFVSQTIPSAPSAQVVADRLALIIEGLCQAVARRCGLGGLAGPFIILIWSRLRRLATRFARHALIPIPSNPQTVAEAVIASAAKPSRKRSTSASPLLPRRKAWLLLLAPETASGASQLRHFLADPEVASLLAQAPQLRRILNPLCHMLGIRAAQALPPPSSQPPEAPPATPLIPCHAQPPAAPIAFPPWPAPPPSPDALPPPLLKPSAEQSKVPLSLLNGRIAEVTPPALA